MAIRERLRIRTRPRRLAIGCPPECRSPLQRRLRTPVLVLRRMQLQCAEAACGLRSGKSGPRPRLRNRRPPLSLATRRRQPGPRGTAEGSEVYGCIPGARQALPTGSGAPAPECCRANLRTGRSGYNQSDKRHVEPPLPEFDAVRLDAESWQFSILGAMPICPENGVQHDTADCLGCGPRADPGTAGRHRGRT